MIELKRNKNERWIIQKNISSYSQITEFIKILKNDKNVDKNVIKEKLKTIGIYNGRSANGSSNTIGVRFSQMSYYMFGYKTAKNIFVPTQSTMNILNNFGSVEKNMLVNLFSIQYPHPFSNTDINFRIYAGRLIVKLLTEEKINCKLYVDEFIWFLPFINKISIKIYEELVESIKEYRTLTYEQKLELFNSKNSDDLFANCLHEVNYYFLRIFENFEVFKTFIDPDHNNGQLFSFKHGKSDTFRNDSIKSKKKATGYFELNENLKSHALNLLKKFSPFDTPVSMQDENVFSKENWIEDLYENDFIKYLSVVFPEYKVQNNVINALSNMTHMSKFGGVDGKDFENSLKPVFELFREIINVEIISGSGNTDLLCTVEDITNSKNLYKINIEAKSRNSSSSIKSMRMNQHLQINNSKYCIIVTPRFSKNIAIDIEGFPIVAVTAESLSKYLSKECLSNYDFLADFGLVQKIISNNLGKNISSILNDLADEKYGIYNL